MTVYVDDMYKSLIGRYGRMKMSHMIADSVEELHAMARKIGIARQHYQGPPKTTRPHYDICFKKRSLAVQHGAQEITMRECVTKLDSMARLIETDIYAQRASLND